MRLCRDGLAFICSVPFGQKVWVGRVGMREANATYYCRIIADQSAMEIWEPICNRGASVGGPGFQNFRVIILW